VNFQNLLLWRGWWCSGTAMFGAFLDLLRIRRVLENVQAGTIPEKMLDPFLLGLKASNT